MKKTSIKPYIQLFATLLVLMSLPKTASLRMQGMTVATVAPAWEQLQSIKSIFKHVTDQKIALGDGTEVYVTEEIHRLTLENQLLKNTLEYLQETLEKELFIQSLVQETADLEPLKKQRQEELRKILPSQLLSVPGRVIYRSPSSWSNTLWINVGENTNQKLEREAVAKNSPVVLGTAVVGVIDYVGNNQSRVRLITDPEFTPSVRAIRMQDNKSWALAKGELKGSVKAVWRGKSYILKGTGFNYDFPDSEGPARDLRTGEPVGQNKSLPKMPIILEGDLLITTGMDGIFPAGLQVATVSKIQQLKEGDYYYDIQAESCLENLDDLTCVYVLPPTGYSHLN